MPSISESGNSGTKDMDQSHYLYRGTIFSFADALNSEFVKRYYNSQKDRLFSFLHALRELLFR